MLPDGLWDQLWESRDDAPYDVAFEADGALLVATGGKGKIFRLAGDPMRPTLLTRVARAAGHDAAAHGDAHAESPRRIPGSLLAVSTGRAPRAAPTSPT